MKTVSFLALILLIFSWCDEDPPELPLDELPPVLNHSEGWPESGPICGPFTTSGNVKDVSQSGVEPSGTAIVWATHNGIEVDTFIPLIQCQLTCPQFCDHTQS